MQKVSPTDKLINDQHIVLACTDAPFEGIQFYYEGMRFADEENKDGSIDMKFEYELVDSTVPAELKEKFEQYIGDALISILEEQVKQQQAVFKGGT